MNGAQPRELAGKFFHLPDELGGWQGQFLSDGDTGEALVQLYSWLTGSPTCQKILTDQQILAASIFDTVEQWHTAAEKLFNGDHDEL